MNTKVFKVGQLLDGPSSEGVCRFLMVSTDAEAWQVERNVADTFPPPWEVGDEVETSMIVVPAVGTGPRPASEVAFHAEHFEASEVMTASQKADIATQFAAFVRSNFAASRFSPPLQEALMRMFRYERVRPHRDPTYRAGMFRFGHFDMACNRRNFFQKIAESDPNDVQHAGLVDLARALRAYTIQYVMPVVTASERHVTAMREREQLRWLPRKHGIPEDFCLPDQDDSQ